VISDGRGEAAPRSCRQLTAVGVRGLTNTPSRRRDQFTVKVKVIVECDRLPDVPVTVIVYVPGDVPPVGVCVVGVDVPPPPPPQEAASTTNISKTASGARRQAIL
jgi:hypothetical protein